jgi:hypothetical protein
MTEQLHSDIELRNLTVAMVFDGGYVSVLWNSVKCKVWKSVMFTVLIFDLVNSPLLTGYKFKEWDMEINEFV